MKNNRLIVTAATQRAVLRPGVTLLFSVSSRADNDLMQKLRDKFCQVTRKTPLNPLTRMLQSCWYVITGKKKKISSKSVSPRALSENRSCLLCGKVGGVSSFSGKTDFSVSSPSSQKPWGVKFLRFSGKCGREAFSVRSSSVFLYKYLACSLTVLWLGLHCDGPGTKEEAWIHWSPPIAQSYRLMQAQSVTPWKGRPAHPGVTFVYVSKCPAQIH